MFDRLRRAFKDVIDIVSTKTLSEKDFEGLRESLILELIENDVAFQVAEEIVDNLRDIVVGLKVRRYSGDIRQVVFNKLKELLLGFLTSLEYFDLVEEARIRKPLLIVFLGVNGVGKTTTIAKLGYMFKNKGFKPLLVAADTFRAGAQEQLMEHGRKLKLPVFTRSYGTDPAAVVYDSIIHAKQKGFDIVLVDTAGRMHTDIDLLGELRKIIRIAKPHYKILVVDALTGNDAIEQARTFNEKIGVDGVIVTKVDADPKGGTILSVSYEIKRPVIYIGTGQRYKDLRIFDPRWFVEKIFS